LVGGGLCRKMALCALQDASYRSRVEILTILEDRTDQRSITSGDSAGKAAKQIF
jgi:hypothetical protein